MLKSKTILFIILTGFLALSHVLPAYSSSSEEEDLGSGLRKRERSPHQAQFPHGAPAAKRARTTGDTIASPDGRPPAVDTAAPATLGQPMDVDRGGAVSAAAALAGVGGEAPPVAVAEEALSPVFIIGGVGQGNLQAALFSDGFAFIYDAGTSAQTVLRKVISSRRPDELSTLFLERKGVGAERDSGEVMSALPVDLLGDTAEGPRREASLGAKSGDGSSMTMDAKEVRTEDEAHYLRTLFSNYAIRNIICVLSHPDSDHFSLAQTIIPKDATAFFLLCGDFLGLRSQEVLNTERYKLFDFLSARKARAEGVTYVTLPYYWKDERYNLIHDYVMAPVEHENANYEPFKASLHAAPVNYPSFFSGRFLDVLRIMPEREREHWEGLCRTKADSLEGIYLWTFNAVSSDLNRQSPIVSIAMREIGMSFVCTGDAHDDAFGRIAQHYESDTSAFNALLETYLWGNPALGELTTLLIVPHHGSLQNYSEGMLQLFKPHMLVLSAGAGTMYSHPDRLLVERYSNLYREGFLRERSHEFSHMFRLVIEKHNFLSYARESRQVVKAYRHQLSESCPLMATNLSGSILVGRKGIETQYTNKILIGMREYRVNLKKSITVETDREGNIAVPVTDTVYRPTPDNAAHYLSDDRKFALLAVDDGVGRLKHYVGEMTETSDIIVNDLIYRINFSRRLETVERQTENSISWRPSPEDGASQELYEFHSTPEDGNIYLTREGEELIILEEDGVFYIGELRE